MLKYRLQPTDPRRQRLLAMAQLMKYLGSDQDRAPARMACRPVTEGETWAAADAERAMRLVRERATSLGIDPYKVGFVGFSAGGMLAVRVATRPRRRRGGRISWPPSTAPTAQPALTAAGQSAVSARCSSPPPPTIPCCPAPRCRLYLRHGAAKGLTAELHLYDKGGHGFGVTPQGTTSDQWLADFDAWMRAHHCRIAKGAQRASATTSRTPCCSNRAPVRLGHRAGW